MNKGQEESIIKKATCVTTNKASEGDGIPVELFQMLKDDAAQLFLSGNSCPDS